MKQPRTNNEEIEQVFCMTAEAGRVWIHAYDDLPVSVRRRMRNSHFNICAACLVSFVVPEIEAKHPDWPEEKLLIAGIEIMEMKVRKGAR